MNEIELAGLTERDVDLLIVEEIISDSGFLSWLLGQIELDSGGSLSAIGHSINTSTGESDIEIEVNVGSGLAKILIENKIDAPFQPNQAERYAQRASDYERGGKYCEIVTVLLAPDDYGKGSSDKEGFKKRVSYEKLLEWFTVAEQLGKRRYFKCALLKGAIERGESGWTLVPDERATDFWNSYWSVAELYAKELRMPKPGIKPATSNFIFYHPFGLAANVKLIHKVPYGNMDLQISGMGNQLEIIEQRYGPNLEEGMVIVKAAKSGAVRIEVPALDFQVPFSESAVQRCLDGAKRLLALYRKTQASSKNAT